MRATFILLTLAACSFDATGLGDESSSSSDASTSTIEPYEDARERHETEGWGETGGSSTGSTGDDELDSSSSTGARAPVSPPYSQCDDPRCGLSARDLCFSGPMGGECTWTCKTVDDCGEPPWPGAVVTCVPVSGLADHICRVD